MHGTTAPKLRRSLITRIGVLAVTTVTTLLVVPTVAARADTVVDGSRASFCYGIQKAGKYNEVLASVAGKTSRPGVAAGLGTLAINKSCPIENGKAVVTLSIYGTQLKSQRGLVLSRGPQVGTRHKQAIGSATTHRTVSCKARLVAWEKIGYSYSDRSFVRPFWIHSRTFRAC